MAKQSARTSNLLKSIGPGLIWAGAAIGVSHLVQSTRAGALYGFGLIWVLVVANLFKYPAFEFGPRYAAATGESLLEGYQRLGKWAMIVFIIMTFGTMFSIQAAVTVVAAGLAGQLFGLGLTPAVWSAILIGICMVVLLVGRYPLLDMLTKIIIITLSISTIIAVIIALTHGRQMEPGFQSPPVWTISGVAFLVAVMGWMPSAIDISVWNSLWTLERRKQTGHVPSVREAVIDFNIGYLGAALLSLGFLSLGALVMYGTGEQFSAKGVTFAGQLVGLYTKSLGEWSRPIILIAGFTTMFSTVLAVTDAFPRVLRRFTELVIPTIKTKVTDDRLYWIFMFFVAGGALILISWLSGSMTLMVDLATTLSFLTAPILAYMNHRVITSSHVPPEARPPRWLRILSLAGITFLTSFSLLFLIWRFML
ncbi:MAG: Nramp family divalent metal transporter [Lentisphaeria bacterium]|nr:Nramp family divalent metal transporter [Candidatus Neomarinimicrobiota bacterium]MCF7841893.1 Nramp family divalent metal transporter [Lentisphaeria bacterium]